MIGWKTVLCVELFFQAIFFDRKDHLRNDTFGEVKKLLKDCYDCILRNLKNLEKTIDNILIIQYYYVTYLKEIIL